MKRTNSISGAGSSMRIVSVLPANAPAASARMRSDSFGTSSTSSLHRAAAATDFAAQPAGHDLFDGRGIDRLVEQLRRHHRVMQAGPELFARQPGAGDVRGIVDPYDVFVMQRLRHRRVS